MDIINVLNNIGNNYSISTDGLATALKDSADVYKRQPDETVLTVSELSGNHHNLFRKRLGAGSTFSVKTSWYGVKIYAEYELFMAGKVDWAGFINKIYEAFDKKVNDMVYAAVMATGDKVLPCLLYTSNEEQLSLASPKENNNNDSNIPDNEIGEQFEQNKKDAIRLLGYDPFENESLSEQPFLYATLIGYLDAAEEANDDRMRLSSIIEIVKGFNHIEKMNDIIARLMDDSAHIESNIGTIKNLEETKSKITASVLKLAADNGISLKHSVNSTKGENTWTGKIRKMKEMNLRDAEVNLYDAEYSAGLSQVADISNASILKQIMLDENDSADTVSYTHLDVYKRQVYLNH